MQTAPNTLDELGRLNPQFVEYMMGLPQGWVTDMNLSRTQQLKMLGNGVVPQQAYYALQQLLNVDTPFEQEL
jgi:DNA (cytosine-5)-methyltransferase 1